MLPAEPGRCKALDRRFFHDAASGACRGFDYGGCDGNANNFESWFACLKTCAKTPELEALAEEQWSSGAVVVACKVGDSYYPNGAPHVRSPTGQDCRCDAGRLAACTGEASACPARTALGTSCVQGGSADGCLVVETVCLPTCKRQKDCDGTGYQRCDEGQCRNSFP